MLDSAGFVRLDMDRLKQYRDIVQEVALLEERIHNVASKSSMTCDVVKGSSPEYPHTQHNIIIFGFDERHWVVQERIRNRLERRRLELLTELEALDIMIAAIPSSKVRQIVELKYLSGLSWCAVASRVYGHPDGDKARMAARRYLKRL